MPGSKLYEEILDILHKEFKDDKISKLELERIIDSQFRLIRNTIGRKQAEVTLIPYLGKIIPTPGHKKYVSSRKIQGDSSGIQESNIQE